MGMLTKDAKNEKLREAVHHVAAEFLGQQSNGTSLITVTGVQLSKKADRAAILLTVLPETQEKAALAFAQRNVPEFCEFAYKKLSLRRLPFITFALDLGEKNRQKLDDLSHQS